ncbi:hypothetical protein ACQ4PT_032561 [Festuca glaucescens]
METALAVTPLVLSTYTIIYKIKLAAEVASQNKDQCDFLAGRLSGIDKLLPLVQQQVPEAAEELTRLGHTLRDAHDLVVDCQNWSMRRKFTRAKRFTEVNARIDSHLNSIPLPHSGNYRSLWTAYQEKRCDKIYCTRNNRGTFSQTRIHCKGRICIFEVNGCCFWKSYPKC